MSVALGDIRRQWYVLAAWGNVTTTPAGIREPSTASTPTAYAMSVAIGIPQPAAPSPVPTIPKKIEHAAGYTLRLGGKLKDRADAPRSEWVVLGSSRASMRTELGDLSWSLVAC